MEIQGQRQADQNRKALRRWAAVCLATFTTFTDWAREGVVTLSQGSQRWKRVPRQQHDMTFAMEKGIFVCTRCCQGAASKQALAGKTCSAITGQRLSQLKGMAALGHEVVCIGKGMAFCSKRGLVPQPRCRTSLHAWACTGAAPCTQCITARARVRTTRLPQPDSRAQARWWPCGGQGSGKQPQHNTTDHR